MDIDFFGKEYLALFITDVREYLFLMSDEIYILENEPDNKTIIDNIFRAIHSIKGSSGCLNFTLLADICHEYETLLGSIREKKVKVDIEIITSIFSFLNIIEKIILYIEKFEEEPKDDKLFSVIELSEENFYMLIQKVKDKSCSNMSLQENKNIEKTEFLSNNNSNIFKIIVKLADEVPMKNVRFFLIIKHIEEISTILSSDPLVEEISNDTFSNDSISLTISSSKSKEDIEHILTNSDVSEIIIETISKIETKSEIQENDNNFSEIVQIKKRDNTKLKEYIKIEKTRIDTIMDTVGELVTDKSRYAQLRNDLKSIYLSLLEKGIERNNLKELLTFIENLKKVNKSLERAADRLQDEATSMRILPIKDLFSRFPRTVRDLASKVGKEIQIEMYGEDIELDKLIIEGLADPILHMMRNSIDHGIEKTEDRIAANKPPKGKIILEATNIGNEVVIRISDDGKGIDHEKVAKKALEKSIITKEQYDTMSDNEKIELIFLPGFSTAESISDISGRGVGMDVVKNNITKLKGKIEIESVIGFGTTFNIRLPLNLAITRALLIKTGNNYFSIPVNIVVATLSTSKKSLEFVNNKEVIRIRNTVVPVYNMNTIFNFKTFENQENINIVILKSSNTMYGFKVDSFMGQQEIVIKNIEGSYHKGLGIAGATILGDGKIAMVIDSEELIEQFISN